MNRKYSGFTLIEMLIVMGIIIILMAVGIAAGRFAINRANDVAHQNAADQIFIAATSHLTDWREYPDFSVYTSFEDAMNCVEKEMGCLGSYLSVGEFRGGSDATYYYWTDAAKHSALSCVSLGGTNDEQGRGFYCTGTGFSADGVPGAIAEKDIAANEGGGGLPAGTAEAAWTKIENWNNEENAFTVVK